MNEPLVSVIVPVYNTKKYLSRCLESIVKQTYKKLEVIAIDNNSSDGSADIMQLYANKDKRVVLTEEKTQGLGSARDKGLSIAKGEWICFVDSDDYIHPQFIEILLRAALQNHCLTAQCRYEQTSCEEEFFETLGLCDVKVLDWRSYLLYIFANQGKGHAPFGVWLNIYHRSLFEDARFDGLSYGEDSYIAPKLLYAASTHPVAIVNQALYYYFIREGSLLHSGVNLLMLDHWYAKECAAHFWKEKGEYELYDWFYSIYFNTLVIDYLRFCVYLPNERDKYDILRRKIIENHEEAKKRGEEILLLHPGAKRFFEATGETNVVYIQYGYGNYGQFAHPFLKDVFGVKEIWDKKTAKIQTIDGTILTQPHFIEGQNVVLLIAVKDPLTNIEIEFEMKKYGINRFVPFKILKFALRYGMYKKYLPIFIE